MFRHPVLLSLFSFATICFVLSTTSNMRPIIGLVTTPPDFPEYHPSRYSSIRGSYVTWIEAAGARVSPIHWHLPEAELIQILNSVNGVVIPHNCKKLIETEEGHISDSEFLTAMRTIVNFAINQTDNNVYYPLYGIDSGMLAIAAVIANDSSILTNTKANSSLTLLEFTKFANESRMYSIFPEFLMQTLEKEPIFWFNQSHAISTRHFSENRYLQKSFHILSNTHDEEGFMFVSSFEGKSMPIYGVQFRPETSAYEWDSETYSHEYQSIKASQLLMNHFVVEARRNTNMFPNVSVEDACLIYHSHLTLANTTDNGTVPVYLFRNTERFCMNADN